MRFKLETAQIFTPHVFMISEQLVAIAGLSFLFCPALFGLVIAYFKARRRVVDTAHESFATGIFIHLANALLSPGIPAYLFYKDTITGGGSMASILALPIIPVTWLLFFSGYKYINKAATNNEVK